MTIVTGRDPALFECSECELSLPARRTAPADRYVKQQCQLSFTLLGKKKL
jgi:hypothetical protein